MDDSEALPGIGPKSRAMLAAAGISSLDELRRLGSVAAYARVRRTGVNASLNLLWALEGALSGTRWQDVARLHRTSLLLALEAYYDAARLQPAKSLARHAATKAARAAAGRRPTRIRS